MTRRSLFSWLPAIPLAGLLPKRATPAAKPVIRSWVRAPECTEIVVTSPVGTTTRYNPMTLSDPRNPHYFGRELVGVRESAAATVEELESEADALYLEHCHAYRYVSRDGHETRELLGFVRPVSRSSLYQDFAV